MHRRMSWKLDHRCDHSAVKDFVSKASILRFLASNQDLHFGNPMLDSTNSLWFQRYVTLRSQPWKKKWQLQLLGVSFPRDIRFAVFFRTSDVHADATSAYTEAKAWEPLLLTEMRRVTDSWCVHSQSPLEEQQIATTSDVKSSIVFINFRPVLRTNKFMPLMPQGHSRVRKALRPGRRLSSWSQTTACGWRQGGCRTLI